MLRHPALDQVLAIHAAVLEAHGGSAGLRDRALLESALSAPQATFGGEPLISDPVEVAAAYLFYLCRNHPFVDGNKRVALAVSLIFLRVNGLAPAPDDDAWESLVLDVASSRLDRARTTARLRALMRALQPAARKRPPAKRKSARAPRRG